jgi:hypothetical protein
MCCIKKRSEKNIEKDQQKWKFAIHSSVLKFKSFCDCDATTTFLKQQQTIKIAYGNFPSGFYQLLDRTSTAEPPSPNQTPEAQKPKNRNQQILPQGTRGSVSS